MSRCIARWLVLGSVLLPAACASAPEGPVVPTPPCVEARFDPAVISPDGIRFVARVVVTNTMRGPLQVERVDYAAELHDAPFVESTFDELGPIGSRGRQTVTLPLEVSREKLGDQVEDVLAEESVRVALRGTVHPVGFDPIPFEVTKVVPRPKLPHVSFEGANGNPLDGAFSVRLRVQNPNAFPIAFQSVDSYLKVNGKRYELLRSECFEQIAPGGSGRITLGMQQTRGKLSSVLVNVARHGTADFVVGGLIECRTPDGVFRVPLEVQADPTVARGF